MRFINPIPFVRDIDRSREFYQNRLGLKVLEDFGSFVLFESGFAIHDGVALEQTVWRQASLSKEPYGRRNLLLYFEHDNVDAAFENIAPHVELKDICDRLNSTPRKCLGYRTPAEVFRKKLLAQMRRVG
ncbi:glyoxalase/bleomycin resistance/extradiol dioxygenase family protein [Sinorhizobium saheli]|jgi:catechol 2,3-dioxygenase-like lactoylglutathione lyase family enzyme|nr:glyoxalase/bleomycin resistance/extradiol dioxygenase family protein [Sinorhizobium saheli]